MNKILVTGAGGFLGQYIVRDLLKKGYQVRSFSRREPSELIALGVEHISGDIASIHDVLQALDSVDAIIHTASLVGMWGRYEDFYKTNVEGTENIIKAAKQLGIKKIVYTSTPSVAFGKDSLNGVDESVPYPENYLNHYAQTKSIAEKLILNANSVTLSTVAIRPHLIFGPGDQNLVPRVIKAAKAGRLKIIGDGENLVDVTYVENASLAHVMALEKLSPDSKIAGKAYFLGQGPIKLWDFTNELLKRSGLKPVEKKISIQLAYFIGFMIEMFLKTFGIFNIDPPMTRFVALQLGTSHYFKHDNLKNDLGFSPQYSIEEGLNRLFSKNY